MAWKKKKFNIKINFFVILASVMIFSCKEKPINKSKVDVLPFYNEATFTPHWIDPNDKSLDTFHRVSSFQLVNQDGKIVTNETFNNKIYVVDFFFTVCPGICPKLTANMSILQDEFLNDDYVLLVSHSVTPERDSVSVLKNYAENNGILSHKWHLVTGEREEIYNLGRYQYFIEESLGIAKEADDFLHTENFVLIDKNKHIRGIYNGLSKISVNKLVADIKTLEQEGT